MDWKEQAAEMYFSNSSSINDISAKTGKSRQAVSGYLKTLPGFEDEKARRKKLNQDRRKEYKRMKNREYRIPMGITVDTMKREHDIAAMILSHEKY